ncbi:hypothetical protein U1Q18_035007 [Sarracenia purpurea var. burkii]
MRRVVQHHRPTPLRDATARRPPPLATSMRPHHPAPTPSSGVHPHHPSVGVVLRCAPSSPNSGTVLWCAPSYPNQRGRRPRPPSQCPVSPTIISSNPIISCTHKPAHF